MIAISYTTKSNSARSAWSHVESTRIWPCALPSNRRLLKEAISRSHRGRRLLCEQPLSKQDTILARHRHQISGMGISGSMSFTYDIGSRLKSATFPGGLQIEYQYNLDDNFHTALGTQPEYFVS